MRQALTEQMNVHWTKRNDSRRTASHATGPTTVPITLEVNLRVPDISVGTPRAPAPRITNSDARFWKTITVSVLPKVGDNLELSACGYAFHATVKRLDWHDDKDHFVVACQFAKRSMTLEEYDGLRTDPDWTMKPLLSGN
jgi:hypothetical protein